MWSLQHSSFAIILKCVELYVFHKLLIRTKNGQNYDLSVLWCGLQIVQDWEFPKINCLVFGDGQIQIAIQFN